MGPLKLKRKTSLYSYIESRPLAYLLYIFCKENRWEGLIGKIKNLMSGPSNGLLCIEYPHGSSICGSPLTALL